MEDNSMVADGGDLGPDWLKEDDNRSLEECQLDALKDEGYTIRGQIGRLLFVTTPYGKKTIRMVEK